MKKQNGKNRLGVYMVAGSLALVLGLPSQVMAREGGFIGAGMGWSSNHVEMSSSALGARYNLDGLAADGLGGSIFAGYGWRSIHGFFAIEANMGMRDAEAEETLRSGGVTDKAQVESDVSYGLGILLGGRLEGATPYLRLGWQTSNYEVSGADSDDQDHDGIRYGVGALLPLQENLDMRLEWNQTRYGEEDYFDGALELKPTESLFTVGVSLRY
ncbi:outer membrane beta-barrel protein [Alloalcanivorax marinus]|uniref:outer membrane beta-barrel protein n=1 Tax=Alloalcanivorax marinus TaxID=1177169 RepID=UPI001931AA07|nr:outer membrane beta-barrel protein [Alloalcanivorax marinus]MBL7252067.1 outer membrane beta-barrel protein [Alloalcanivorax marinus]